MMQTKQRGQRKMIAVKSDTFDALAAKGQFGETWDDLLARLAKE